jgi:hypothetical protein
LACRKRVGAVPCSSYGPSTTVAWHAPQLPRRHCDGSVMSACAAAASTSWPGSQSKPNGSPSRVVISIR